MGYCVFSWTLTFQRPAQDRVRRRSHYRYGGALQIGGGNDPALPASSKSIPKVKEIWFRGSHPDIGGKHNVGAISAPTNNPSLRWMVYEAAMSGLIVNREGLEVPHAGPDTPKKTLQGFWTMMEYLPIEHRTYTEPNSVTVAPHLGKMRVPVPGQKVHDSVPEPHRPPGFKVDKDLDGKKIPEPESVQHCADCYFGEDTEEDGESGTAGIAHATQGGDEI